MRILFNLVLTILVPSAWAGGMVGNGGDASLQDFNLRGIQLAAYFKADPQVAQQYGIDAAAFLRIVQKTTLESKDLLILNGVEVDAINYPSEFRIEVSRTRWVQSDALNDAYFVQRQIALHEYLWVYGIPDENYAVSNPIITNLEKSATLMLDPEVRRAVFEKFCERIYDNKFVDAQALLTWGMDLNQKCPDPAKYRENHFNLRPLSVMLQSYVDSPWMRVQEQRKTLIRKMLEFGANPNEGLRVAAVYDLDVAQTLIDFGANPNSYDGGGWSATAFALAAPKVSVQGFWLLFNAGGDVNLSPPDLNYGMISSPAREIVASEHESDLVEALLQTGKVDWCGAVDTWRQRRTIDEVLPEYKPLLEKYHVACEPFALTSGSGPTCLAAQEQGKQNCQNLGFTKAIYDPGWHLKDGCYLEDEKIFEALFHCVD